MSEREFVSGIEEGGIKLSYLRWDWTRIDGMGTMGSTRIEKTRDLFWKFLYRSL